VILHPSWLAPGRMGISGQHGDESLRTVRYWASTVIALDAQALVDVLAKRWFLTCLKMANYLGSPQKIFPAITSFPVLPVCPRGTASLGSTARAHPHYSYFSLPMSCGTITVAVASVKFPQESVTWYVIV